MNSLTIRNLDDATKQRLRVRAAHHGVSMEEEVRRILKEALRPTEASVGLGTQLRDLFAGLDTDEFVLPERHAARPAPTWNEPA
jgi:plasmid stability protein